MNLLLILQFFTIVFSPLYILRTHFFIPITFLEVCILATIVTTICLFFQSKDNLTIFKTDIDTYIFLLVLICAIEIFVSYNFYGGLGIFKAYFLEPILFYYCLVYSYKKKAFLKIYNYQITFPQLIIFSLILASLWLSLLGLLQKITHQFSLAPNEIKQGRISAVYNSANSLALFVGPVIMLTLGFYFTLKTRTKVFYYQVTRFPYLLLLAFFTLIIVWTKSRGGLIAEMIALIAFSFSILSSRFGILKKYWYLLPISLILIILAFFYQTFSGYRYQPLSYKIASLAGDTLQIRYFIWIGTIQMLKDHPIFGAGLDGFKTLYSQNYLVEKDQEIFQYPHNLILTFWTETGILGLIAFVLILEMAFKIIFENMFKGQNIFFGAALLSALTYILIHGIVDVPVFKNDLSLEFWVILALISYLGSKKA